MEAGDPGGAGNDRADRRLSADGQLAIDSTVELRSDDRTADEALAELELTFGVKDRHAGAAARAGRRAIDLARAHRDSVQADQRPLLANGRRRELTERNMVPIRDFGMFETELFVRRLGDSHAQFGKVARFISVGESAARGKGEQLAALAASEAQMRRYAERREQARSPPPVVSFVGVKPGSELYGPTIDWLFRDMLGKPLDPSAVARRISAIYGRGGLDTLDYHVVGDDDRYGLELDARPSSLGRTYMRFGLALQDDFQGNSSFNAAVRFVVTDVTRNGGEWVTDLNVGSVAGISTELFLPLAQFSGWFVMPHALDMSHDLDYVQGQTLLAQYRVHTFDYGLDFGRQFGNWGEIRTGIVREQGHFRLEIGDPNDPNIPDLAAQPFDTTNFFVRFTYDRLDDINFPHRGQQAVLQWTAIRDVSGSAPSSDQVTLNYLAAHTFGRNTLVFSASGGMTLQAQPTDINLLFPLGGFLNLSGLRADSLFGPNFGITRLLYYRQIGRGGPGYLDLPTYIGASFEVGNVWQQRSEASLSNTEKNASLFLGIDTLLGPVYLATGFDAHGNQEFYLFLGRTF